jgi:hypothetical protein
LLAEFDALVNPVRYRLSVVSFHARHCTDKQRTSQQQNHLT